MHFERLKNFIGQFKRYLMSIGSLFKGLFLFKPTHMIKLLALAFAGTSLQAFSLGTTFFILRHMDSRLMVKMNKIRHFHFLHGEVHAGLLLSGILAVLGVAIYLLYLSEKANFEISRDYANKCGTVLIDRFPVLIGRMESKAVNPGSGIPLTLSSELSSQSLKMCLAIRLLLKSPTATLQVLYGIGILLTLEPLLTLILTVFFTPVMIPLKRLAIKVKESERLRKEAERSKSGQLITLSMESGKICPNPEGEKTPTERVFDDSGYAKASHYRAIRWTAVAGSRAVATGTMVVGGIVCMLFFGLTYMEQEAQVATIVVYFGALRMAVMSSRQVIVRLSNFARFYDQIQGFVWDNATLNNQNGTPPFPKVPGIEGIDLTREGEAEVRIEGNGPFAVAGIFPLLAINRYMVTALLPDLIKRRQASIVAQMAIVDEKFCPSWDMTWRDFLGEETDAAISKLKEVGMIGERLTPVFESNRIAAKPLTNGDRPLEGKDLIVLMLLRSFIREAPVVVVASEALDLLGTDAAGRWITLLKDRLLFIYYRYEKQAVGRWGETHLGIISPDPDNRVAVVPVGWANQHQDVVFENASRRGDGATYAEDWDYDDDDDDDG